ncbi:hypothetical protein P279_18420 [Rhodobacteraceae bacterium PD-2]|nr:hypothetical protein P279_18420 [Rhodobacteraceae bacterium PD-2]
MVLLRPPGTGQPGMDGEAMRGWDGLQLRNGMHLALRSAGGPQWLDGVFATRAVTMAKGTALPFVGTRWKCVTVPGQPGLWRLVCQNHDDYCLGADAPAVRLEKSDPDHVLTGLQWLLYRRGDHMMIRSRGGDWLGCKRGSAFCAPLDDLDDPRHHWIPETYW